ncbi:cell division protein ZipA C-terminal FtsZ-binding domain-containing protein [Alcaligenes endophyticus]|uniref:Cell division protein ZipA n=1 Tax=Alcaligenes endophyticus TaxID=1929088 RepID=A0ABT8EHM0_9BURK|nr:cell division protein ZipA C-terminal FtsZ-binding domain-containing protein [Alcaligenes endophyticus]MCX5592137.1 hypothetical protein [Alcaligenes endophyticus]MDN4120784.1 hypothetical protein [Alcaligenes endophyticus]
MSDLQIGLILAGVLLILLVLLFNWWQDRQARQQMQSHFPERENDPLMSQVFEPVVGQRREPTLGDGSKDDEVLPAHELDPTTEAVIDVSFAHPLEARDLAQELKHLSRVGTKPVRWLAETTEGHHHDFLQNGQQYVALQLAVLLANRSGAISDIEWSQLWTFAQTLANLHDGQVEGPELERVVGRGQALDHLCAELDAQVGLSIRLAGPMPAQQVIAFVKEAGFLPFGRQLAWLSDAGIPRFLASFDGHGPEQVQSASIERVDLLLDLPNSPADGQAFSRMAAVARDLAGKLDAVVLDDSGRPLPEGADDKVDEQISEMYQKLEAAGFVAGTSRTTRVFA